MSDGVGGKTAWARYVKSATERPGWNVAKLARESGVHRSTIHRWINGGGGNVTVDRVRRLASTLGDDPDDALRVAGDLVVNEPPETGDEEIDRIMRAPVDDALKDVMIKKLQERRERERLQRIADFDTMIDIARRGD
jgi:transcriptional regulator with XRE-family HTH domain